MRIVDVRERPVRISRYRDPHIPSGGLTTSLVAVVTDVARAGRPVVGYGFGRWAHSTWPCGTPRPRSPACRCTSSWPAGSCETSPPRTCPSTPAAGTRTRTATSPRLRIIDTLAGAGWPRHAFWPHGGHLFSLPLVAALGLGGAEITPLAFHPFHGPPPALAMNAGRMPLPDVPGIGFELHDEAWQAFRALAPSD